MNAMIEALIAQLRFRVEHDVANSRERSVALTKLDEVDLWLAKAGVVLFKRAE